MAKVQVSALIDADLYRAIKDKQYPFGTCIREGFATIEGRKKSNVDYEDTNKKIASLASKLDMASRRIWELEGKNNVNE